MASYYNVTNYLQYGVMEGATEDRKGILESLKNMKIVITKLDENDIEFDLMNVDVSLANALRRIFIAEVPTVAIETVYIEDNTSIIQDEVLSHRLGLIPLKIDPSSLEDFVPGQDETNMDTVVINLDIECPAQGSSETPMNRVYSGHMSWTPMEEQEKLFPNGVAPVNDDILIAELSPGQRISLSCYAHRGVGKDHAKFSPVATASYRLLPDIVFKKPVTGALAEELVAMCPMGVFDMEEIGNELTAKVVNSRQCTMCRECIRKEGWSERVELHRKAQHFLFSVESTGCIPPERIVRDGIAILKQKAEKFKKLVVEYESENMVF